jgi:hypothetical protein
MMSSVRAIRSPEEPKSASSAILSLAIISDGENKRVVVRIDETTVMVYDDFAVVARHERRIGRGETVTDRGHYPEYKRKGSQEIHYERIERIRAVGAGAAVFYAGLLVSRDNVHSDSYRALLKLIESTPGFELRSCLRSRRPFW